MDSPNSEVPDAPAPPRRLVQYGLAASLGAVALPPDQQALPWGSEVLLHTPRGTEVGVLLESLHPRHAAHFDADCGTLLRPLTADDRNRRDALRREALQLLERAAALAESLELPLLFLDGEVLFDRSRAILQAVHHAPCDATPLFARLTEEAGLPVLLHDLTTAPEPPAQGGCGSCGSSGGGCSSCGSGSSSGGGCSTGGCASGKVASAEELTAYFANLRQQMEAKPQRVPLA